MPLPLVLVPLIPWITGAAGSLMAVGGGAVAMTEVKRAFNNIGPEVIQASFDKMGIVIDATHPINDETLTAAVNASFLAGTGLEIESVFDREKLKRGLKKMALAKAADQLGFAGVTTEAGLSKELTGWLSAEVMAQMKAEAGEVFDAAKESARIRKLMKEAPLNVGWNTPVDFSAEGVSNRERQAKYRATHKRTWVLKDGGES